MVKKRQKSAAPRPSSKAPALVSLRKQIYPVDHKIQTLIAVRAGLAKQDALAQGEGVPATDYYRPEHET